MGKKELEKLKKIAKYLCRKAAYLSFPAGYGR
jgi:hypothetical protein